MSDEKSLRDLTLAVYVLQAIGLLVPVTWIVAVVINYVKKNDASGSWLESHFRWQILTFWFGLLGGVLGGLLALVLIGYLVWAAVGVWIVYRIVKGWLYLNDGKPLPA